MDDTIIIQRLLYDLFVLLTAGFFAGIICKRLRLPMVVGYLLIGALIGSGMLGLFKSAPENQEPNTNVSTKQTGTDVVSAESQASGSQEDASEKVYVLKANDVEHHILTEFAHLGANLLLFVIGIHFSPSELGRIWKHFLVGGLIQMLGVILPFGLLFHLVGSDWKVGIVLGCAVSLSSTVLVFKSLEDMGLANSLSGLRAVAILLFQDVAIVPLLVLIGILAAMSNGNAAGAEAVSPISMLLQLAVQSVVFIAFIVALRWVFLKYLVPFLLNLKNVELIVLFTMILLIGVNGIAGILGLPGALGALAAGVVLSDTRLTHQVTAITVAMRETFSAIFFVSLGALFDPRILFQMPVETIGALAGCLALKTAAAGLAFWALGLPFLPAFAMGLGLSQLGELSFILIAQGYSSQMFSYDTYQIILFVALCSILLTPLFLKIALNFTHHHQVVYHEEDADKVMFPEDMSKRAIVVGLGPIGGRVVTFLETSGFDVTLIDMNPVNLHPFAQSGFHTISGNANDVQTLKLAEVQYVSLFVVSVPSDTFTEEIVDAVRELNDHCIVMARCRYSANISKLEQLGANIVLCGETEISNTAVRTLQQLLH